MSLRHPVRMTMAVTISLNEVTIGDRCGDQSTEPDFLFGDVCGMTIALTVVVTISLNEVTIGDHR